MVEIGTCCHTCTRVTSLYFLPQTLQGIHQEQLACKDATIIKLEAEVECLQDEVEQARAQAVRLQAQMEMAREGR